MQGRPSGNAILDSLPAEEFDQLELLLQPVTLESGLRLQEAGSPMTAAYFPVDCLSSIVGALEDGNMVEAAVNGRQGVVGAFQLLGAPRGIMVEMVQVAGGALRLPLRSFHLREFPHLETLLRAHLMALVVTLVQTATCNRMHNIEQRTARWMLMADDAVGHKQFVLTHDFLAMMLGVRRPGVTLAAAQLARDRLIRYSRGRVTIIDRGLLEREACECYWVARERSRTAALLPD